MQKTISPAVIVLLALTGVAHAQSPEYMKEYCANATQGFFANHQARTEMKYEGQRTDGTHAVNGTIYLETRSDNVQCSFNKAGDTLVDYFAEGETWPEFVKAGKSPYN